MLTCGRAASVKRYAYAIAKNLIAQHYDTSELGYPLGLFDQGQGGSINRDGTPGANIWWTNAAAWDALIEYWARTGDGGFNSLVSDALVAQAGKGNDFQPANQSRTLDNDDIASWALAAMTAAERRLPYTDMAKQKGISWAQYAQNAFDVLTARWGNNPCNGGLRYAVTAAQPWYDMASSGSGGNYYQLAARLYRYTGNETHGNWASKTMSWLQMDAGGLVQPINSTVYEAVNLTRGCHPGTDDVSYWQWSIDLASIMHGAAIMGTGPQPGHPETVGDSELIANAMGLMAGIHYFQDHDTGRKLLGPTRMFETDCEQNSNDNNCTTIDYPSYKGPALSWLSKSYVILNYTAEGNTDDTINMAQSMLYDSAKVAQVACDGGPDQFACGTSWNSTYDGFGGFQQQATGLSAMISMLDSPALATQKTPGDKPGDKPEDKPGDAAAAATTSSPNGNASPAAGGKGTTRGNGTSIGSAAGGARPSATSNAIAAMKTNGADGKLEVKATMGMVLGVAALVAVGL